MKYYLIEKGDKGYGYSQMQSVLQLNYDSTFVKTVTFQNNNKRVNEIIDIESYEGKWHLNEDTLILEYNPIDSILLDKSKFLVGKRKIYYIPTHDAEREKINPKQYPWKVLAGKHITNSM